MAYGKFVSYLRVSTQRQGISGLGLEAQREAVASYLNGGKWSLVREVVEVESGKRNDRPAIAEALRLCRLHRATLIIAKLDRLARNVHFISSLMESGVEFVAVDFPQANRLTVHIQAAVAEHEASMISARTKAALGAAKARGVKLGGQRGNLDRMGSMARKGNAASAIVRRAAGAKRNEDLLPVIEDLRAAVRGVETVREADHNRDGCALLRICLPGALDERFYLPRPETDLRVRHRGAGNSQHQSRGLAEVLDVLHGARAVGQIGDLAELDADIVEFLVRFLTWNSSNSKVTTDCPSREEERISETMTFWSRTASTLFVTSSSTCWARAPGQLVTTMASRTAVFGSFRCGML
jgi:DNA invertase Pin-like site-specific DNA recombinase